jgi:alkylated DNA repair protein (DNA oxidative demethylase)
MHDLFGEPVLPGLQSADDFVTQREEQELIRAIDDLDLAPFKFQGWLGKRLTHSFGLHYDFEKASLAVTEPMPPWLLPTCERATTFAGLAPGTLVQALITRYDPGAGIGWHRDRPPFDHVVGISLGEAASMRFRKRVGERFERATIPLPPRGIYHLQGVVRYDWEHSIAEVPKTRWSITFRSVSDRGRQLLAASSP